MINCTSSVRRDTLQSAAPMLPLFGDVGNHGQDAFSDDPGVIARLESAVAERVNARHCIAVSDCTTGLKMVLNALGLRGEVILPSLASSATGHALRSGGFAPAFADCDAADWCVDPNDIERRITGRTAAILATHLYGNPARVEALETLAKRHKLKLIFDAAHALGSRYEGRAIGQFGDAEVFAFSPTRLDGDGGLIATNDPTLARSLRAARNCGAGRMTEMNAHIALATVDALEPRIERHNEIAERYTQRLSGVEGLSFQSVRDEDLSVYAHCAVHFGPDFPIARDEAAAALLANNIETRKHCCPPLHERTMTSRLPRAQRISAGMLSLPAHESLSDAMVDRIAFAIRCSVRPQ